MKDQKMLNLRIMKNAKRGPPDLCVNAGSEPPRGDKFSEFGLRTVICTIVWQELKTNTDVQHLT